MKYSQATNYALHTMLYLVALPLETTIGVQQSAALQAMEEQLQFRGFFHRDSRPQLLDTHGSRHQAWFRPSACHIDCTAGR